MGTPSVAASTSPTFANVASRSPPTLKPLAGVGALAIEERVTEVVPVPGGTMAPSMRGRSRSGGTSSGRDASGCSKKLSLRNKWQPDSMATARHGAAGKHGSTAGRDKGGHEGES